MIPGGGDDSTGVRAASAAEPPEASRATQTDEGGEHGQASLRVAHLLKGRRQEAPPLRMPGPPEVSQEVSHRQPEAKQQEEGARNGVPTKVGHCQT